MPQSFNFELTNLLIAVKHLFQKLLSTGRFDLEETSTSMLIQSNESKVRNKNFYLILFVQTFLTVLRWLRRIFLSSGNNPIKRYLVLKSSIPRQCFYR
jgi:hypothetical protein